jgi:hypothetical protein
MLGLIVMRKTAATMRPILKLTETVKKDVSTGRICILLLTLFEL